MARKKRHQTVLQWTIAAINHARRSLSPTEIQAQIIVLGGPKVLGPTLRGLLSRCVRDGEVFTSRGAGRYGLRKSYRVAA